MYAVTSRSTGALASRRWYCETRRHHGVYAMGSGWTGALGTGSLDASVLGHDDEQELAPPPLVYRARTTAIAAGWGHTAIIVSDKNDKPKLMLCGRPHDFQALLRLNRLPAFVRQHAVHHSLRYHHDVDYSPEKPPASPTLVGRVLSWMLGEEQDGPDGPWEAARKNSIMPSFSHIPLPDGDVPSTGTTVLDASAGLTAVIGASGTLYTFGTNHRGQCGVGETSNNVWLPQKVMGLSTEFAHEGREHLEQQNPIISVSLGLQHGLALDNEGNLYAWGKGERGQLGQGPTEEMPTSNYGLRVTHFRLPTEDGSRRLVENPRVTSIAAGMNRSSALTDSNQVFVWGKNVMPPDTSKEKNKKAVDSAWPVLVQGLPENLEVIDIACGSHHTVMLMADGSVFAVGITTDDAQLMSEAAEIIPPGVIEMPCRQFEAHFDRTTIVGKDGRQVLQVHLWSDEELQENAVFTPPWVEHLLNDEDTIRAIQRGWLHTVISTDN